MDQLPIRLSRGCYTVGWISALQSELTAAMSMLDERHEKLPQPPGDTNTYVLGHMAGHDVVLACLPEMGTTPAARVAKQMSTTFSHLRFGLLVGIGGGIPSETHDIRLGDVVVGTAGKKYGAVVQWDYGQRVADGEFVHRGSLNAPPPLLSTAINTLRAEHNLDWSCISHHLNWGYSRLSSQTKLEYQRPATELDVLFESNYEHPNDPKYQSKLAGCENCDKRRIVRRAPRQRQNVIHYGTIASGNQVIKHGTTRDSVGANFDALCFEMEAAGIVDDLPCIVIRGICDYADSHKNKRWQGHAAMIAAAYAKELLSSLPGREVNENIEPGSFSQVSAPCVKLGKSHLRMWCEDEQRVYWQDYWHEDRILKRRRLDDPHAVKSQEIQELEKELTRPTLSNGQAPSFHSRIGSRLGISMRHSPEPSGITMDESMETRLSNFMQEYRSELLLQLADFPEAGQQRGLFSAMLRLTRGQLDKDSDTNRTLLHWLAMNGEANLLPKLVELGFGVDDRESDCRTPLHLAVIGNHYKAVEMLIDHCGASCHVRDLNGLLPWHHALHIDWDNISDNELRAASKKSIIRLLARHTEESEVRSPSLALKLLRQFKKNPDVEVQFMAL